MRTRTACASAFIRFFRQSPFVQEYFFQQVRFRDLRRAEGFGNISFRLIL